MTIHQNAHRGASTLGSNRVVTTLARVGFAASGLVHVLLGYLAIRVAFHRQEDTDQGGALAAVAKLPGGVFVLWIAVVGLFGLALWLVIQAVLGIGSSSKKRWVRSIVSAGKAVAYLALGITALTFARGGSSDSGDSAQTASASVLSLPGGPILLGIAGLGAVGIGGYFIYKGIAKRFTDDLSLPPGRAGRTVTGLGVAGYVAKGIAVTTVGILLIVAAVQVDPDDATGLDGALKSLAALPFGIIILTAVGVGLIAYGIYTFVRARYARL
jgi:hypothetical protein